jgi:hypothetical protein
LIVAENHLVLVRSGAGEQRWPLTTNRRGRDWLLTLTSPDGKSWDADGPDLFKALRALRRILDPLGIRLGVNGARRDAWPGAMPGWLATTSLSTTGPCIWQACDETSRAPARRALEGS